MKLIWEIRETKFPFFRLSCDFDHPVVWYGYVALYTVLLCFFHFCFKKSEAKKNYLVKCFYTFIALFRLLLKKQGNCSFMLIDLRLCHYGRNSLSGHSRHWNIRWHELRLGYLVEPSLSLKVFPSIVLPDRASVSTSIVKYNKIGQTILFHVQMQCK